MPHPNPRHDKASTEVLVVGAGPIGLWSAVLLSERGIPFQILDREYRSGEHNYAITLHPSTLKMLSEVGLLEEVIENGRRIDSIGLYEGAIRQAQVSLSKLPTEYPFLIVVPQSFLEGIFERKLQEQGAEVFWNRSVADLEIADGGVRVAVDKLESVSSGYSVSTYERVIGGKIEIEAKVVIGADGYHSSVRRILGIPFDEVGPAELFALIEFETDAAFGNQARITWDESRRSVVWPLPDGRCCGIFQLDPTEVRETQTLLRVQQAFKIGSKTYPELPDSLAVDLVRQCDASFAGKIVDIDGSMVVRFEQRLARRFGMNSVWLCGDAARTTGPIGAHSANAGFVEAYDLVSRIAQVRAGGGSYLMHRYGEEHLSEWTQMVAGDDSISFGRKASPWISMNRARLVGDLPATGPELVQLLAQLDLRFMSLYDVQYSQAV